VGSRYGFALGREPALFPREQNAHHQAFFTTFLRLSSGLLDRPPDRIAFLAFLTVLVGAFFEAV
jgi:hypothetical protein